MTLTKDQRSLLLYLETRAVDHLGRVDASYMNADDFAQAEQWTADGFLSFGRICHADVSRDGAYWVQFTEAAWSAAHAERRARAERLWEKRNYRTTAEKRAASEEGD